MGWERKGRAQEERLELPPSAVGRRCSSPVSQWKKRGEGRGSSELACLSAACGAWRIHVIVRLSER
jgi:hypothetical protein